MAQNWAGIRGAIIKEEPSRYERLRRNSRRSGKISFRGKCESQTHYLLMFLLLLFPLSFYYLLILYRLHLNTTRGGTPATSPMDSPDQPTATTLSVATLDSASANASLQRPQVPRQQTNKHQTMHVFTISYQWRRTYLIGFFRNRWAHTHTSAIPLKFKLRQNECIPGNQSTPSPEITLPYSKLCGGEFSLWFVIWWYDVICSNCINYLEFCQLSYP